MNPARFSEITQNTVDLLTIAATINNFLNQKRNISKQPISKIKQEMHLWSNKDIKFSMIRSVIWYCCDHLNSQYAIHTFLVWNNFSSYDIDKFTKIFNRLSIKVWLHTSWTPKITRFFFPVSTNEHWKIFGKSFDSLYKRVFLMKIFKT